VKRLRVLTLIDQPRAIGGAERLAVLLTAGLDRNRFEPYLCSSRAPAAPSIARELEQAGVRHLVLERSSRLAVWSWRPLVRLLRREKVDVLHAHMYGSNLWGTLLGRLARVPVVIAHEHSWSFEGDALRKFLDREVIGRGVDAFLAVSRKDARRIVEIEGIDPEKVRFLPIGIPDLPEPTGRALLAELGIPPDAPVAVAVGRLRPPKALDVLIRAASRVKAEVPAFRVVIAGEGEEEPRLRALIRDLGLEETVFLVGRMEPDTIPDLLAAAGIAVSSSSSEGSPLAIMEYMASARAIVATRVGGVPDLIRDGTEGLLVEPGDERALAGATLRLLRDPALRRDLGQAAKERQRREFSLRAFQARVEDLYVELYERSSRRKAAAAAG
jgi:glycosyltransferase involved in cell wall biosynthesis